ncbi:MAG: hypothetical protein ACXVHB_30455 [Solirubrobacteraceae bacterium]
MIGDVFPDAPLSDHAGNGRALFAWPRNRVSRARRPGGPAQGGRHWVKRHAGSGPAAGRCRLNARLKACIGLTEIGGFRDHDGYDGVFLAVPGTGAHLDLTAGGGHRAPAPP